MSRVSLSINNSAIDVAVGFPNSLIQQLENIL